MWGRLSAAESSVQLVQLPTEGGKDPTLKMRDPYPNTTNGEGAIVLVLFQVTVTEVGSTPSHYISTPLLGRGRNKMTGPRSWESALQPPT